MGGNKVKGNLAFHTKMNLTRKAICVLDGNRIPEPIRYEYARVASIKSARIAFTYTALNVIDICSADIINVNMKAPSSEKDYIIFGPEFGLENVGKKPLIRGILYGGKAT